ncbi:MAG: hypothetical protein PHR61_00365 [Candidatus Absconditabacteria bacterium]|nr:hypothetical protein [Candidatus Absconditabacteria bacterium]
METCIINPENSLRIIDVMERFHGNEDRIVVLINQDPITNLTVREKLFLGGAAFLIEGDLFNDKSDVVRQEMYEKLFSIGKRFVKERLSLDDQEIASLRVYVS